MQPKTEPTPASSTRRAVLAGIAAIATATGAGVVLRAATDANSRASLLPDGLTTEDPTGAASWKTLQACAIMMGTILRHDFSTLQESFPGMDWPQAGRVILSNAEALFVSVIAGLPRPVCVHYRLLYEHFLGALLNAGGNQVEAFEADTGAVIEIVCEGAIEGEAS